MLSLTMVQVPGRVAFYWNVSANVGMNSPNDVLDVHFVQFGIYCSGINYAAPFTAEQRGAFSRVIPGTGYSGQPDDPLTLAILALEKNTAKDGHVSKMPDGAVRYIDGNRTHAYLCGVLSNNIFDIMPQCYPRLDRHPRCPSRLAAAVREFFKN